MGMPDVLAAAPLPLLACLAIIVALIAGVVAGTVSQQVTRRALVSNERMLAHVLATLKDILLELGR